MRRTPAVLATLSVLLLTACGPKTSLNLDLRSVSITVPRLLTPAVQLVPATTTPPPVRLPQLPPLSTVLPAAPSFPSAPAVAAAPPPVVACPKAGPLAVPAKPAGVTEPGPPAPGTYLQTSAGSFAGGPGSPSSGSLAGPVTEVVTALPRAATTVGQPVDSYRVERTDSARKTKSVELYQLVHPSSTPGATAGGIYLVGLAWTDPIRGDLSFQPTDNPLEILPLPVQVASSAAQYADSATDPNTLTTLTLVRNVTGRKRIDACGQLIDTFTVEMTGTLTTATTQRQLAWTQHLATAYGGVDVDDTLALTSPVAGFSWIRSLRNTTLPKDVR